MVGRVRFFCTYRKSRLGPKEHAVNRNERVARTLVHELVSLEKHIHTHTHTRTRQTRRYSTCALIGQNAPVKGIGGVHEDALWRHTTELSARARARVVRVARAM